MKKVNKFIAFALITLISLASCKKVINNLDPRANSTDELFQLLKSTPQNFTVQAGTYKTIIGSQGTRIHFNPQSFKDASGNYVTSGTVNIALIETLKATDMLLNRTTTMVGSGILLQSGGSINIRASQGGQSLSAGRYGIDFVQDAPSALDMSLFQGTTDNTTGITTWLEAAFNPQQGTTSDSSFSFFQFDSASAFNWVNCDRFYNDPRPKTDVTININGVSLTSVGAMTFMIFPEINAITNLYLINATNLNKFSLGAYYQAPVGIQAHFVTIAKKGDDYYYGELKNQTISNQFGGDVNLSKKTAVEIEAAIKNLY